MGKTYRRPNNRRYEDGGRSKSDAGKPSKYRKGPNTLVVDRGLDDEDFSDILHVTDQIVINKYRE